MLPVRLTLIGTIHRDPRGEERLGALLAELAPDYLTLEMSPTSLRYRQQHGRLLLQRLERIVERLAEGDEVRRQAIEEHPSVVDIRGLLALPFEYRAAIAYAEPHGRSLMLIDDSEVSQHKLRQIETELINYRNLRTLISLAGNHSAHGEESYTVAHTLLAPTAPSALRSAYLDKRRGSEGIGPRDRQMATALLDQARRLAPRHMVHIGGWVHLIDDPAGETLFSRLAPLAPERRLLD